ncbi:VOC family protein [Kocuria sp.]|uniref:VOC family protein n=1 Tax=Kocuria sp. TaxID=1871328 RepID=UPI0026E04697|nr:VOC family protein [Kocuria sp.]MDO5618198.1 VOC family protein [Kocuria sp.]
MADQFLTVYLSFRGQAADALNFYASVFGGDPQIMRHSEMGAEGPEADWVMHGQLDAPNGMRIMAADVPSFMDAPTGGAGGVSLCLHGDDVDALRGYFTALSEGGTVNTPLEKQAWGDEYGDLVDKFGIQWSANIAAS